MSEGMNGAAHAVIADKSQATNRRDLARQIQIVVNAFVRGRAEMGVPMQADEIVGVIAFCAGSAIGMCKATGRVTDTRPMIEMALKFFADGQLVAEGKRPASEFVIMPDSIN
jgi:hypothetical protein